MERIPILQFGSFLLVSIQVDLHDNLALALQDDLCSRVAKTAAKGVVIDISALEVVDSFVGRVVAHISGMARILGAQTVLVGMRPAVAITLVELGVALGGVRTARDIDAGVRFLERHLAEADDDGSER
jgi:rsbT antagonist protein RsbS